ncbi:MAG: hypothetical protein ABIQ04_04825 [Candidatus Saccharimonadales bacterium]
MSEKISKPHHESLDTSSESIETIVERVSRNDLNALHEHFKRQNQVEMAARQDEVNSVRNEIEAIFTDTTIPSDEIGHEAPDVPSFSDNTLDEHIRSNDLRALQEKFTRQNGNKVPDTNPEGKQSEVLVSDTISEHEPEGDSETYESIPVPISQSVEDIQGKITKEVSRTPKSQETELTIQLKNQLEDFIEKVNSAEKKTERHVDEAIDEVKFLNRQVREIVQAGYSRMPNDDLMRKFGWKIDGIVGAVLRVSLAELNSSQLASESAAVVDGRTVNTTEIQDDLRDKLRLGAMNLRRDIQTSSENASTRGIINRLDALRADVRTDDLTDIMMQLNTVARLLETIQPSYAKKIRTLQESLAA